MGRKSYDFYGSSGMLFATAAALLDTSIGQKDKCHSTVGGRYLLGGGANGPFVTQDEAARAALTLANPQSIRANREYGGLIYRGTDDQYYYTGPVQGSDQGVDAGSASAPAGTQVVGRYHTHGDYSTANPITNTAVRTSDPACDDFDSDHFSTQDIRVYNYRGAGIPGFAGYLGTPGGIFRRYDPATGVDTTF